VDVLLKLVYLGSKWRETHLIPDTQPKIDIETITRTAIYHRLDQLLTRDFNDPKNAYYTSLPNPHRVLDQQLFTKLADLYASCMNQDVIEKLGVTPLYPLFRSIQSKVPLSGKNQDLHSALTYLSDRNIWTFFQLSVQPDILTNPSQPILVLQQGPVGLPHRSLYDDPDVLSVYMQVVTAILDVIFKQDHHGEFGWGSWSTVATARRIVEFEKKLAQYNSSSDHLERWSLERLSEQVPQVNWSAFIKRHLDPLPLPTHLLVASPHFLKELNDVLKDASPRTLQMYLTWRTIDHHLEALGDTVMMHKRLLDAKLMGIEPRVTLERRNTCVRLVDQSALGELMGRYFVMDHRERFEQAKRKVEDMAQTIVGVIKTRVSTIEWADEKTKQAMLEKVFYHQIGRAFVTK
jgi:predicted metalloendopeptidase